MRFVIYGYLKTHTRARAHNTLPMLAHINPTRETHKRIHFPRALRTFQRKITFDPQTQSKTTRRLRTNPDFTCKRLTERFFAAEDLCWTPLQISIYSAKEVDFSHFLGTNWGKHFPFQVPQKVLKTPIQIVLYNKMQKKNSKKKFQKKKNPNYYFTVLQHFLCDDSLNCISCISLSWFICINSALRQQCWEFKGKERKINTCE